MNRCYVQLGVDMRNEDLEKMVQDAEQLISDAKKVLNDVSAQGSTVMKSQGIAFLDKALERINVSKSQIGKAGDYALCKAKVGIHEHPLASLSLAAILGAVVGAMIARK